APPLGRDDHFFELGGHSLAAMRAISEIRDVLGVPVPLRWVFECPTVAELSVRLERAQRGGDAGRGLDVVPAGARAGRSTELQPTSFGQRRLWIIDQLDQGLATYNVPLVARLRGALDVDALSRALGEVVRRHEVLRTCIRAVEGEPFQQVAEWEPLRWVVEDAGESWLERVREAANLHFDLGAAPMYRFTLLRIGAEDHVLVIVIHHIAADAWSMGILMDEVTRLYEAYRLGHPSPLSELAIQYSDYAVWQRRRLREGDLESELEHWRENLRDARTFLELVPDHPRGARVTHRGGRHEFQVSDELTERLGTLCRAQGATLHVLLLAAFQTLLARLTGQTDIIVGTPHANRGRGELDGLVGFFVNTLPIRADLAGRPSFAELTKRLRKVLLAAHAHHELPFEVLVEDLRPDRDLRRSPIFQVMFDLHEAPEPRRPMAGITVEMLDPGLPIAKYELSLFMTHTRGALVGTLEYSADLFEADRVEQMGRQYIGLLEQVVEAPEACIDGYRLLSEADRYRVLVQWNATAASYPHDLCVHELFEGQVARTPDAVAVECDGEVISYAELNARSNRLAQHLRSLGVGPEGRVGICSERSVSMVGAVLATHKAGGAFVPLDTTYPAERLGYMVQDSGAAVTLTYGPTATSAARLAGARQVVDLEADVSQWANASSDDVSASSLGLRPGNLAYVIYTSGSTGTPKGVTVTHGSVVNLLSSMQREPGMSQADVLLAVTTLSFDIAVLELELPLSVGARLVVATREQARDGAALCGLIERHGVTMMQGTPATWRLMVSAGFAAREGLTMLCGGEALPRGLAAELSRASGALWNVYGPTETTIWSLVSRVPSSGVIPIGRAIGNTQAYVLDGQQEPLPAGVEGELYVGGAGVARGYLGRSELTSERFVPDPFSAEPGARLYRTGDLGRWLADGTLEYLGRNDHQVKIRGYRIELGEIESRLSTLAGVDEVVVVAWEDVLGDRHLVAYYAGDPLPAESMRAHASGSLPAYMVPSVYVHVGALPVTANGKLDRRALPSPTGDEVVSRGYEAPQGEVEQA